MKTTRRPIILFSILAALIVISVSVMIFLLTRSKGSLSQDEIQQIALVKSEAEALAIAGKLPESHARYQQIEQLIAGRRIRDTALWDLVERAKYDQDRIYSLILSEHEAEVAQRAAAATRPIERIVIVGNEPPKEEYPSTLIPTTRPIAAVPTTQPSPLAFLRPLLDRVPSTVPATQPVAATTRPAMPQMAQGNAPAQQVPITPMPIAPDAVTDQQIGEAIQKGVNFLLTQFDADQIAVEKRLDKTHLEGLNALVVYSLLSAGQAIPEPRLKIQNPQMAALVDRMKDHLMLVEAHNLKAPVTYARSLRAAALAVHNRPQDRDTLQADVIYLVNSHADGAYTYNDKIGRFDKVRTNELPRERNPDRDRKENREGGFRKEDPKFIGSIPPGSNLYIDDSKPSKALLHNGEKTVPSRMGSPIVMPVTPGLPGYRNVNPREYYQEPAGLPWDNSNSQYGLLGVWSGAEVGIEIPGGYWAYVDQHWKRWQLQTGEWEYDGTEKRGYFGMTVAGIASLFVTHDYLEAPALGAQVGREPYSANLAAALKWLEMEDNAISVERGKVYYRGYNLFGLQRAARACGFKYFGKHDWYKDLATAVVSKQWPNGAWGRSDSGESAIIDTAYTILFLARGRHPVLMNKLRFDGYWNNRPRDLHNLATIAGRELERVVNWQIVSIDRPHTDWLDSPILFISSHTAPKLKPDDYTKLRLYADAGGLIFTHADASSNNFNSFAGELAKKVFPEYPLATLPVDHEIYSIQYPMKGTKPQLKYVTNGSRVLMLHSPTDLTTAWQVRDLTKRPSFELPINLFIYASGKAELRNRLNSPHMEMPSPKPVHTVRVGRIKHGGNWNPEPHAWDRFSRYLKQHTGWIVESVPTTPAELELNSTPIAHLTGTSELTLNDADAAALKAYVEAGGTLLIDPCGGSGPFAQSTRALLTKLIPQSQLQPLVATDALFRASSPGMEDLGDPRLRPFTEQHLGKAPSRLEQIKLGKGRILFSPIDISTALVGSNAWGILGYEPAYALKLLKNITVSAGTGHVPPSSPN